MHRKSLTGEAKLNRDKAMLNDYIAGMHIAELAEKYGIGCTNVKKSLEVLEGFDAVRRNEPQKPEYGNPTIRNDCSKADMESSGILRLRKTTKTGPGPLKSLRNTISLDNRSIISCAEALIIPRTKRISGQLCSSRNASAMPKSLRMSGQIRT